MNDDDGSMMNDNAKADKEKIGHLAEAVLNTLRETEGVTDAMIITALLGIQSFTIASVAKSEEHAVAIAGRIGQQMKEEARWHFQRLSMEEFPALRTAKLEK